METEERTMTVPTRKSARINKNICSDRRREAIMFDQDDEYVEG